MELYTIQMSQWRIAKRLGIEVYDTTVRSGGDNLFKPTWGIVGPYKRKELSEDGYRLHYVNFLRLSYNNEPEKWLEFLKRDVVAVACYCAAGKFCHRYILADLLSKICHLHQIPFVYKGEITPTSHPE